MTGTLRANTMWDWMPFMAGLNGEEGPHAHRNPEMELKVDVERLRRTTVLGATPSLGNLAS